MSKRGQQTHERRGASLPAADDSPSAEGVEHALDAQGAPGATSSPGVYLDVVEAIEARETKRKAALEATTSLVTQLEQNLALAARGDHQAERVVVALNSVRELVGLLRGL